jgi:endo-1,4-beta-xylanase
VRLSAALLATLTALSGLGLAVFANGAQAATATLRSAAEAKSRYFGAALANGHLGEAAYASAASTQFDMATPENEMKWDTIEPSSGSFNYGGGDAIVSFAQSHSMRVRGHNLVWHSQLPGWVTSTASGNVKTVMDNHITNEVTHYKGKIYAWDVVNEPFDDNGNLRTDVFDTAMGSGYIAEALRTARAADPSAKLYLNDYNIEATGAKSNAMFSLVSSLISQGVPIDGVGFESHFILGQVPATFQSNMARFAALGLDVAITELDIRMSTGSPNLTQQANDYRTVVNACLAVSRCVGITTWGVTDKYSWIPDTFSGQGLALLFDTNYTAKPAFDSVITALGGAAATTPPPSSPTPTRTSTPTPPPSSQTPPPPTGGGTGCTATYSVTNSWQGGFGASVTVRNGSSARSSWTVSWTFANGQTITQLWNGAVSQSGSTVTVTNLSYNGALGANASTMFGFNGTWNGTNSVPSSVTCR